LLLRHVIFGSETLLGGSVLRVLVSAGETDIIACTATGDVPEGVASNLVKFVRATVVNIEQIESIIQEGDVIYNCEVNTDENSLTEEYEDLHFDGLLNLVEVANKKSASRIITHIPQLLGWQVPIDADEETVLRGISPHQQSFHETLEFAKEYLDDYDLKTTVTTELAEELKSEDPPDKDVEENGDGEQKLEETNKSLVSLCVVRLARFLGAFDHAMTEEISKAVRLRRMTVVGKIDKRVSFINTTDAGRAMIILSDLSVKPGMYHLKGFDASLREVITAIDAVNASTCRVKSQMFAFTWLKYQFVKLKRKIGLTPHFNYHPSFSYSKFQVFSDEKAKAAWNWKPRYNLVDTAKQGLEWYVNHAIGGHHGYD